MASALRWVLCAAILLVCPAVGRSVAPPAGEDRLPAGALGRFGSTRLRHGGMVNAVAISADGTLLASAGKDGAVCLWDRASGRLVRTLSPRCHIAHAVAFSADGRMVAASCEHGNEKNAVRVWDARSGALLRTIPGLTSDVHALAFSPRTGVLAGGDRAGLVRTWDARSGKLLHELTGHCCALRSVAWSDDGKTLASCGDSDTVRLWDAERGKSLGQLLPALGGCEAVAFLPGGRQLAVLPEGNPVTLYDIGTRLRGRTFEGFRRTLRTLAVPPDGKRLAAADEEVVYVWDRESGRIVHELPGHRAVPWGLAFSPDGKTLASTSWNAIRLWDVGTGGERFVESPLHGSVAIAALSPDGRVLATASDCTVALWDTATGRLLRRLDRERTDYLALHLGKRGRLSVWERSIGLRTLEGAGSRLRLRWEAGDLRSASGAVLDAAGEKLLAWTGDSRGEDSTLSLWDAREGKRLRKIVEVRNDFPVTHLIALSGDGALAAEANWLSGASVRVYEATTGWQRGPFRLVGYGPGAVSALALSHDGGLLAAGTSAGTIHLWETRRGAEVGRLTGHKGTIKSLAFSPDGRLLGSGGEDGAVRLWESATGQQRECFLGHRGAVCSLCFAQGSKRLVSGSGDTTALLWDVWRTATRPRGAGSYEQRWRDLADRDARRAFEAARWWLGSGAAGTRQMEARLRPVPPADGKRLARLLAEVDSGDFQVREAASRGLEEMGERIEPDLRRVLDGKPSPEARRRLERIVEGLQNRGQSREDLRAGRALEVLEQMATAEAEGVLRRLARGAPGARLTREAAAGLRRLGDAKSLP
jgi:WD40 repeat protein